MKKLILTGLLAAQPLIATAETTPKTEHINISEKIDCLFDYFNFVCSELKVNESAQSLIFSPDFQMIINGKIVVDGRENLTAHFEHIIGQVTELNIHLHEKVVAADKAILRYDMAKPGKSTSKVIAIFKFKDGQIYEMNEVVHSLDPSSEIDFTSR